jgi:probable F420-dependent oxidoreductase
MNVDTDQDLADEIGIWISPEGMPTPELHRFASVIETLGYSTLWIGETFGRDPFATFAGMTSATERIVFATGIANVYNRHAGTMKQGAQTVAELCRGRFILGLGVSSPQIVERHRGLDYSKPLSHLRSYLDAYDAAPYMAVDPPEPVPIVLAALGPKMLELAAERTSGAHTYNVTPQHTAMARGVLGPDAKLYVEQKVMLTTDATQARAAAAGALRFYRKAPGYRSAWLSLGFTEEDIDGPSNRYVDAIVAWGDESAIRRRIREHLDAGANQVCIQPIHPTGGTAVVDYSVVEALAPIRG